VWTLFLVPASSYDVVETWNVAAMRGTGSNTVVTRNVFVPAAHAMPISDLVEGTGPGGAIHDSPIYRSPFVTYGLATFIGPMLGAMEGALDELVGRTAQKRQPDGTPAAASPTLQTRLGRIGADIDATELLMRRALDVAAASERPSLEMRARCRRDAARAAELLVSAAGEILALSGTSGFALSNPIQRAWRDVNLAARHISINPDDCYSAWSQCKLGIPRDPTKPIY
jgi:alkylation response protein AidB-like acyl-CoA dehydrogenase